MADDELNPDEGLTHLHGTDGSDWLEHSHMGGGIPHEHDPETGFQVPLGAGLTPAGLDTGGKGPGAADSVSSEVTASPGPALRPRETDAMWRARRLRGE
jgi:hypothetical protein